MTNSIPEEGKHFFTPDLSSLVDSLEKAERRFFSQWCGLGQSNQEQHYLQLYRAYLGEAALPESLPAPTSAAGRQVRRRLRQQLLRSLQIAHQRHSPATQLRNALSEIELLFERGLYSLSLKRLRQARKLAIKFADLPTQRHLLQWEVQLSLVLDPKWPHASLTELQQQENELLQQEQLATRARQLFEQVKHFGGTYTRVVSDARQQRWDSLKTQAEAILISPETHFPTWAYLQTTLGILYLIRRDLATANDHFQELITAWPAQIHLLPVYLDLWIVGVCNHLNVLLLSGKFYEFSQAMKRHRQSALQHPALEAQWAPPLLSLQLLRQMNTGELEGAQPLTDQIASLLDRSGERLPPRRAVQLAHNVAMLYFLHREFREARRWCRRIADMPTTTFRVGIQEFGRLWLLFLYYEAEELDLMAYRLDATQRYFKRRGKVNRYEQCLLDTAAQLVQSPQGPDKTALFTRFHQDLLDLQSDPSLQKPIGIQEMWLWAQSQKEGRSLKAIFVEAIRSQWRNA